MPHTARAERPQPRVSHAVGRSKGSYAFGPDFNIRRLFTLYYGPRYRRPAAIGLKVSTRQIDRWVSGHRWMPARIPLLLLERLSVRRYELVAQHARALDELARRHAGRLADLRELETILRGVVVRPGPPRHWSGLRKKKRDP